MTIDQVLNEFRRSGALLKGHFILSSGLHSDTFLQKALVFQYPKRTAKLCRALATKLKKNVKGRVYEVARALNLPAMFVEREQGEFRLRRGFQLGKGQRVLMVEDIITTGLSSRECIAAIEQTGAKVVAAACLIDRSGGRASLGLSSFHSRNWTFRPMNRTNYPHISRGPRGSNRAAEAFRKVQSQSP
jgi:orotate phosphoribosyltransferase